jgi:hypothetical protein
MKTGPLRRRLGLLLDSFRLKIPSSSFPLPRVENPDISVYLCETATTFGSTMTMSDFPALHLENRKWKRRRLLQIFMQIHS